MSTPNVCAKCGRKIEGNGPCRTCAAPSHAEAASEAPLRLRQVEDEQSTGRHGHLLDPHAPLLVKAATADPHVKPTAISAPEEARSSDNAYAMGETREKRYHDGGPRPFWMNAPSLFARSSARTLRTIRDWGYLISVAALVLALIGFLFKFKGALHVGVVVAIVANVGIFVVGAAYLVMIPFKEGLRYGLANLLIPFYAIYYWYTRWPRVKKAVRNTVGAFLPIVLAAVAYLSYEDGAKVVELGEREIPIIEGKIEEGVKPLEVGPVKQIEGKIEGSMGAGQNQ